LNFVFYPEILAEKHFGIPENGRVNFGKLVFTPKTRAENNFAFVATNP